MSSETALCATGLLLGTLTAADALVLLRVTLRRRARWGRLLWLSAYMVHLGLMVEVLGWVARHWFATVARGAAWDCYLDAWLLPYATSMIWFVWRHRD